MKKIKLRTRADLEANPGVLDILLSWNVCSEIEEHVGHLGNNPMRHTTVLDWGVQRTSCVFHPSSLTNPCDRFLFYELVGAPETEKLNAQKLLIFDTGTVIHEQLQYYQHTLAERKGFFYDHEVAVSKDSEHAQDLHLGGSTDGYVERLLRLQFNGEKVVIDLRAIFDYKSASASAFSSLRRTPNSSYVKQTLAYMWALDVPLSCILYYNKDTSLMRNFLVPFRQATWSPIEQRLRKILEVAKTYKIPMRSPGKSCRWCKFFEECDPPLKPRQHSRGALKV